jgi:hypothetical protein
VCQCAECNGVDVAQTHRSRAVKANLVAFTGFMIPTYLSVYRPTNKAPASHPSDLGSNPTPARLTGENEYSLRC